METIEKQKHMNSDLKKPLSNEHKRILTTIFVTLLIDIMGFSVIFPVFPEMSQYYLTADSQNWFLSHIFGFIELLIAGQDTPFLKMVLFGGVMTGLYSFLQFLSAPLWGKISDRVGRRPVMLFCLSGLCLSYFMWIFAASFTLLFFSRILAGFMSGNISTATAIVSDISDAASRVRNMAVVGIAIAMGFIAGPVLGAFSSKLNLLAFVPGLHDWGGHPFSGVALVAFLLSVFNIGQLLKNLPETFRPEKTVPSMRTANILKLILPSPLGRDLNLTHYSYLLFILGFSGIEFVLTFLAMDRFQYTSMDNGKLFLFIGFCMTMIQGGVLRRKKNIDEKSYVLFGLFLMILSFWILYHAFSQTLLYLSLALMATGASICITCMTALSSRLAPEEQKGEAMGGFRSLGALGRSIGPILFALVYWRFGGITPFLVSMVIMFIASLSIYGIEYSKKKLKNQGIYKQRPFV